MIAQEGPLHKDRQAGRQTGPYKAAIPAAAPGFACLREKEQEGLQNDLQQAAEVHVSDPRGGAIVV